MLEGVGTSVHFSVRDSPPWGKAQAMGKQFNSGSSSEAWRSDQRRQRQSRPFVSLVTLGPVGQQNQEAKARHTQPARHTHDPQATRRAV